MKVEVKHEDGVIRIRIILEKEDFKKLSKAEQIVIKAIGLEQPVKTKVFDVDNHRVVAVTSYVNKQIASDTVDRDVDMVVAKFIENGYSFRNSLDTFVEDVVSDIKNTEKLDDKTLKDILYSNAISDGIVKDFFIYRDLWKLKRKYVELQKEAEMVVAKYRQKTHRSASEENEYKVALVKNKLLSEIVRDITELLEMNPFIIPVCDEKVAETKIEVTDKF